jgi:hypothetical protein
MHALELTIKKKVWLPLWKSVLLNLQILDAEFKAT